MDVDAHFQSLSAELTALKDRVRHLIGDTHWLTDGEHKEAVLRNVLRRHVPETVGVGSGFVIGPDRNSTQIDVLLYDATKPTLYRDGDFVMVSGDAVLGLIEVKSRVESPAQVSEILNKLADLTEFVNDNRDPDAKEIFVGLFSFETGTEGNRAKRLDHLLNAVSEASVACEAGKTDRIINHIALGPSEFVRFWHDKPGGKGKGKYLSWHAYDLENRAFGYFIHNAVAEVSGNSVIGNEALWFPSPGKELDLHNTKSFKV